MDAKHRQILHALFDAKKFDEATLFLDLLESYGECVTPEDYSDLDYKEYIYKHEPTCKVCNALIRPEMLDHSLIRNLDCMAYDWTIGCCCCGSDPKEYHLPSKAQYFCGRACLETYRAVRNTITTECNELRIVGENMRRGCVVPEAQRKAYEENEQKMRKIHTAAYSDSVGLFCSP